jgi:hypothetical protein
MNLYEISSNRGQTKRVAEPVDILRWSRGMDFVITLISHSTG